MVAVTAEEIAVDLLARSDKLERQLRSAEQIVDRRLGGMESRGQAFAGRFSAALAGVSTIVLAREFLQTADASKQMEAQLRLATASFGSFTQAQKDVQRIAAATRSGLQDTTTSVASFLRAGEALGKTQAESARAAETFNKALLIGGAGTAQAASATLQLSQALGGGAGATAQWEELGQLFEASPRIQRLVADSLGVTTGALKKLASDGKITTDALFDAFSKLKLTAGIDAEFKTLPVTFDQAMTSVRKSAIITFGAFDRGGDFSNALANFVGDGADGFDSLSGKAQQLGVDVRTEFAGLANAFDPLVDGALAGLNRIGVATGELGISMREVFALIDQVSNAGIGLIRAGERARQGYENARGFFTGSTRQVVMTPWSNSAGGYDRGKSDQRRVLARQRAERAYRDNGGKGDPRKLSDDALVSANNRMAADLNAGRVKPGGDAPRPRVASVASGSDKKKPKGPKGPSAETLAKRAKAEEATALRNAEAFESEKASRNQDILRARQATAVAAETVAAFEIQEIEAARVRQNASYQADVKLGRLKADEAATLAKLNNERATIRADEVRLREEDRLSSDRATIAQGDLANARELAQSEAALADTAAQRRAAALRILDLDYQIERMRSDVEWQRDRPS